MSVERGNCIVILAHPKVGRAQDVPCVFVFGFHFRGALEELNRHRQIAAVHGRAAAFHQIVSLHICWRRRRARDRTLDRKKLPQVRAHCPAEGLIVRGAWSGQFVLPQGERPGGGKGISFQFVSSLVVRVVTL